MNRLLFVLFLLYAIPCTALVSTTQARIRKKDRAVHTLAYRAQNNGVELEITLYTSEPGCVPKQLQVSELKSHNILPFELRLVNNTQQAITLNAEHIEYKTLTLADIDNVFGWKGKKIASEVGFSALGAITISLPALSMFNPYLWKQHGFVKTCGTLLAGWFSCFAAKFATWAPQFEECKRYDFARLDSAQNKPLLTQEIQPYIYISDYITGPLAYLAATTALITYWDKKNMDLIKKQYLHEPVTLMPGQVLTTLFYVFHNEFKESQQSNEVIPITCYSGDDETVATFEVPTIALAKEQTS